ncbi:MAG: endo alpha-1,4 polygalactosaminidase [Geobacteraceae bacterium]|nr:endo alpha-1,4 polygalactosaminidase [Geobacteraceae bacterium]
MRSIFLLLVVVVMFFSSLVTEVGAVSAEPFSVAFYYAEKPPLDELQAFDIVVVDPDAAGIAPQAYKSRHSELFAYISVGEADPQRRFYKQIKPEWLIGNNPAWKSKLVDLANPDWRRFFLDQVVEPLWSAGYRGFFLDTLDSFLLVKDSKKHPALMAGLVDIIRSIKQRHPDARLILNRGFEVLDQVKDTAFAVAAESLFQKFDPINGTYGDVQEHDRQWLLGKFAEVRKAGLPVIAIDYVAPKDRELARRTAARIKELGCIPWVTDKDLATLGIGAVEVLPRKVLGLYDGQSVNDPANSDLHHHIATPLNYMGYQLEMRDLRKPLPTEQLAGRYAGIVIWPHNENVDGKNSLAAWVRRQIGDGVKVLFIDGFGMPPEQVATVLGLEYRRTARRGLPSLKVSRRTGDIGFEAEPSLQPGAFARLKIKQGEAWLTLTAQNGEEYDAAGVTSWGGYVQYPYGVVQIMQDQARWVVNPFSLLSKSLGLEQPVAPDPTTENGVRLLLAHIDADGFESYAEWPGGRYAGVEMREKILKRYKIPTAVSVITGIVDEKGLYPAQAAELQKEFRETLALPWIEAATHTYSHPYYWQDSAEGRTMYSERYLKIPGYTLNYETEVVGSVNFINSRLLPLGKKVTLLQWSGDCTPPAEAIRLTYTAGIRNINSGDTVMTVTNPSLTAVASLGVAKEGWFQVFAPNQNENVYTNDWKGPFYGYRRVIETFRMTDAPRRLKPVNIYYHFYSASKLASLQALLDVYNWAMQQELFPIYTSAYADKVLDFNRTVVAGAGRGWLIRNKGDLRQLRLPVTAGYPDLAASRGVIGFSDHNDQRYIHLAPGGEALLVMASQPPGRAWLSAVSAEIKHAAWTSKGMRLTALAHVDGFIRFGGAAGCKLMSGGRVMAAKQDSGQLKAALGAGQHEMELVCK